VELRGVRTRNAREIFTVRTRYDSTRTLTPALSHGVPRERERGGLKS
jgi:hypothetical protein